MGFRIGCMAWTSERSNKLRFGRNLLAPSVRFTFFPGVQWSGLGQVEERGLLRSLSNLLHVRRAGQVELVSRAHVSLATCHCVYTSWFFRPGVACVDCWWCSESRGRTAELETWHSIRQQHLSSNPWQGL